MNAPVTITADRIDIHHYAQHLAETWLATVHYSNGATMEQRIGAPEGATEDKVRSLAATYWAPARNIWTAPAFPHLTVRRLTDAEIAEPAKAMPPRVHGMPIYNCFRSTQ